MNCANAEKLLPLYTRVDLDMNSHSAVTSHLQSCPGCRQLADEYKDTQRWMRLYEPPGFSEELFASIRRDVLREVGKRPKAASSWSTWAHRLVAPPLSQRMFASTAAALLVITFAIALFVFRGYRGTAELTTKNETVRTEGRVEQVNGRANVPVLSPEQPDKTSRRMRNGLDSASDRKINRRKSFPTTLDVARLKVEDRLVQTTELTTTTVDATRSFGSGVSGAEGSLRVEIQTQNPDIRIIWFAPNGKQSPATN